MPGRRLLRRSSTSWIKQPNWTTFMADKENKTINSEVSMSTAAKRGRRSHFLTIRTFSKIFIHITMSINVPSQRHGLAAVITLSSNCSSVTSVMSPGTLFHCLRLCPIAIMQRQVAEFSFVKSSWLHRLLWRAFYQSSPAWRWRSAYPVYATLASYLAPLSLALIQKCPTRQT